MKKFLIGALVAGLTASANLTFAAPSNPSDPEAFAKEFREYFHKRFPDIAHEDYNMGIYAMLPDAREQYESMMEFPPQDNFTAQGDKLWNSTVFPNGKTFKDCLGDAKGLRAKYPFFDTEANKVRNLEVDIMACQKANGVEKPWNHKSKELAAVSAYLASQSAGMKVNVTIPNDKAVAAFNAGKEAWFRKTGQLNMSCADCHQYHSGQNARAETLSGGIGKTVHFPVFRYSKDKMLTLHDRLFGCVRDTSHKPYANYSDYLLNLEYFLSYIDNGLVINGPGLRK